MFDIAMPSKVRLLALKTLLSARLAEGRIIVVDNFDLQKGKTRLLASILNKLSERETYLLVDSEFSPIFKTAGKNLNRIKCIAPLEATITDILNKDKVIFSIDGLLDMMRALNERTVLRHRPKAIKFTPEYHNEINADSLAEKYQKEMVESVYF